MAEEKLLNTSTLSTSVEAGSFSAWAGPIVANQLDAAISSYRVIAHQYIQLLDVVSNIAGPAMVPTGTPRVHGTGPISGGADGIVTWNWTASPDVAGDMNGWNAYADPIDSPWRYTSSRAANAPSVFLDRRIYGPYTGYLEVGAPTTMMQNGVLSGVVVPHAIYYNPTTLHARVRAVNNVKIQIFTGVDGSYQGVCTVEEFVRDIARPLLEAYQSVVEKMYSRLKATTAPDGSTQRSLWATLNIVTPDATRRMYEKLEVLRTPDGQPLFSPARQVHTLRDHLVRGVIDVMFDYPVVSALSR